MNLCAFYIAEHEEEGMAVYCDDCGRSVLVTSRGHVELGEALVAAAIHHREQHG